MKIEEEGISFRRLDGQPRDWSRSYPYQAFEVADEMYMLAWYEEDTGDFVTLVIDFNNDTLYGGAYFAADKSSMLHSATVTEVRDKKMENATDEELVRAVVNDYISGTYEADIGKLRGTFNDKASMYGFLDGQLIEATPEPFLKMLVLSLRCRSQAQTTSFDRKCSCDRQHCICRTPETGFGPFNFTDYFHLLKKDGEWRIVSKTFTTE